MIPQIEHEDITSLLRRLAKGTVVGKWSVERR